MSANAAIAAGVAGELTRSVRSAARCAPLCAVCRCVSYPSIRRPDFLAGVASRVPQCQELKGKALGIATITQPTFGSEKILNDPWRRSGRVLTFSQVGDEATQLQAMISNSIQVAGLTPPYVFLARDKFKRMSWKVPSTSLPASSRASGCEPSSSRSRPIGCDGSCASKPSRGASSTTTRKKPRKSWRGCGSRFGDGQRMVPAVRRAFTPTGIPTDEEIEEFLAEEALALKLTESVPASRIFDFTLQRAVNKELGIKG